MFGQNEIAHKRLLNDGFMLHSIFYTIQGEGPWSGMPAVFVRFSGCNLRCSFCDTDFAGGTHHSLDSLTAVVLAETRRSKCSNVVLTGGEPMLQEIGALMDQPCMQHLNFQIETAGTVWPLSMTDCYSNWNNYQNLSFPIIVCSPKTPKLNPLIVTNCHHWKYIIRAEDGVEEDGLPPNVWRGQRRESLGLLGSHTIWVQPCDDQDPILNEHNLNLVTRVALEHGYRVSYQLHKLLGVD